MKELDRSNASMKQRLAELEARLAEIEQERSVTGRSRSFMRRIIPAEASTHFKAAGREQLLGIRALVDFWIGRLDGPDSPRREREEIQID